MSSSYKEKMIKAIEYVLEDKKLQSLTSHEKARLLFEEVIEEEMEAIRDTWIKFAYEENKGGRH